MVSDSPKRVWDYKSTYHDTLLREMRSREGDVLKFLAFVVPALTGFAWLLTRNRAEMCILQFTGVVILIELILLWGAQYVLALSYNCRCLQLQLVKLERQCGLHHAVLTLWQQPKCFVNCKGKLVPDVFRVHLWAFNLLVYAVGAVSVAFIWLFRFNDGPSRGCRFLSTFAIVGLILFGCWLEWCRLKRYVVKHEKLWKGDKDSFDPKGQ